MPTYNSTIERQFSDDRYRILTVKTASGSLSVKKMCDGTWLESNKYSANTVTTLFLGRTPTLFEVTGDVKFEVEE